MQKRECKFLLRYLLCIVLVLIAYYHSPKLGPIYFPDASTPRRDLHTS